MDRLLVLSLLLLGATVVTSRTPLVPFGGSLLLLFVLLLWRSKRRSSARSLHTIFFAASVVLGVGSLARVHGARAQSSLDHFARVRSGIPRANAICFGAGSIHAPATLKHGRYVLRVYIERPTCDEVPLGDPITLELSLSEDLYRENPFFWGDQVSVMGQVSPVEIMDNPELTWREPFLAARGVHARGSLLWMDRRAEGTSPPQALLSHFFLRPVDHFRLRARDLLERTLPGNDARIARALVLGENDLQREDERAFRLSGLSHLLAVSGMHLVLVVGVFERLLRGLSIVFIFTPGLLLRRDRLVLPVLLLFVWAYCFFAGASGSAVRASWMYTFVAITRAHFVRLGAPKALALSILAMLFLEPLVLHDPSFALSVSATLGLVVFRAKGAMRLFAPPAALFDRWTQSGTANAIRESLRTSLATAVCTAPLLLTYGNGVAVFGVVANVVAIPMGEACALPISLLLVLVSLVTPLQSWIGSSLANALVGSLALLRKIAGTAALFPLLSTASMTATLRNVGMGESTSALRLSVLDVGQGDSLLLELPDGTAALVDGGGLMGTTFDVGETIVGPVLRARGIETLRLVVLSHPHPDHFLGLQHVVNSFTIGSFWAPDVEVPRRIEKLGTSSHPHDPVHDAAPVQPASYQDFSNMLRAQNIAVEVPPCHSPRWIGGAIWTVLAPCPKPDNEENANNHSLVIRIAWGKTCFLLTGDAEREEEARTLTTMRLSGADDLHCDVLKVGHHGSRTSTTPAWLAAVSPSIAAISAGRHNRFGHPHPTTLETLRGGGVRVLQTNVQGQIRIVSDGLNITVEDPPARKFWGAR
ncbi:MAG: ComEC/Rec2 family competence protein [Polyangiaceae bacterium]|nr:ComEC/Rec2 family competence protein [Polyangiaceae bacterium]